MCGKSMKIQVLITVLYASTGGVPMEAASLEHANEAHRCRSQRMWTNYIYLIIVDDCTTLLEAGVLEKHCEQPPRTAEAEFHEILKKKNIATYCNEATHQQG